MPRATTRPPKLQKLYEAVKAMHVERLSRPKPLKQAGLKPAKLPKPGGLKSVGKLPRAKPLLSVSLPGGKGASEGGVESNGAGDQPSSQSDLNG